MLREPSRARVRNELRTRLAFRFADLPMATGVAREERATAQHAAIRLVLLGTPRLELADRTCGSACDDPRIKATLYDFDANEMLQSITYVWERPAGPAPAPIFQDV